MIYLASPYSHPHAIVRERRFQAACRATSRLIAARLAVFSPIVFGHPLANHGLPTDWSFWEPFDREHLRRCDEVVVLTLEGWRESVGIAAELKIAADLGMPIAYLAVFDDGAAGCGSQNVLRTVPCPSK